MKKLIFLVFCVFLTSGIRAQWDFGDWHWNNPVFKSGDRSVFVLTPSLSTWIDTSQVPPTPWGEGYATFDGFGDHMFSGHNPYFNLPYNLIDTFRIELVWGYVAPSKPGIILSCYALGVGWAIQQCISTTNMEFFHSGAGGPVEIVANVTADTLLHRSTIIYTKSNSRLRAFLDGALVYTYNSYTFDDSWLVNTNTFCVGNLTELNNGCSYAGSYSGSQTTYSARMKIAEIGIGKNDSMLVYKFNQGNFSQVMPVLYVGGELTYPIYPYEYCDRWKGDSTDPGSLVLMNGVAPGPDSMDASFYYSNLNPDYRDCYIGMNYGFTTYNSENIICEVYGGQSAQLGNDIFVAFDGKSANGDSIFFPGDRDSMNNVATWDGAAWKQMSHGLSGGGAMFIAPYMDDRLVALGYFTQIVGGPAVNYVATYRGSEWEPMGTGFNAPGFCGVGINNDFYAGGFFTTADGNPCNHIAKWDGNSWYPLSGGVSSTVNVITPYPSDNPTSILAGGVFTSFNNGADDIPCFGLAQYVFGDDAWFVFDSLQTDEDRGIYDILLSDDGWIYFGGNYRRLGGREITGLARYKNGVLQSIGSGIGLGVEEAIVTGLCEKDSIIYAVGQFTRFNGRLTSRNVCAWNKYTGRIKDMGYGFDKRLEGVKNVTASVVGDKILFVGDFYTINGQKQMCVVLYDPALNP